MPFAVGIAAVFADPVPARCRIDDRLRRERALDHRARSRQACCADATDHRVRDAGARQRGAHLRIDRLAHVRAVALDGRRPARAGRARSAGSGRSGAAPLGFGVETRVAEHQVAVDRDHQRGGVGDDDRVLRRRRRRCGASARRRSPPARRGAACGASRSQNSRRYSPTTTTSRAARREHGCRVRRRASSCRCSRRRAGR